MNHEPLYNASIGVEMNSMIVKQFRHKYINASATVVIDGNAAGVAVCSESDRFEPSIGYRHAHYRMNKAREDNAAYGSPVIGMPPIPSRSPESHMAKTAVTWLMDQEQFSYVTTHIRWYESEKPRSITIMYFDCNNNELYGQAIRDLYPGVE